MSQTTKEQLQEFEADYKMETRGTIRYLDDPASIKPHGIEHKPLNKYQRHINSTTIDVYDVLVAFEVNNPATAHAVKKLLASGKRGYKDIIQDLEEAVQSINRAIEIEKGE